MLHQPAAKSGPDPAFAFKKRLGVWMFLVYAIIYAGFVLINLVKPRMMEATVFAGTNLAVFYGFGLIVFAIILSLVYSYLCTRREQSLAQDGGR
jgi:uncharacterized membrane protein (DUF485 family)